MIVPRYPIYIPSKGRHKNCATAKLLIKDRVPFYLVVEPQEREQYARYGEDHLLVLPFRDQGSVIPTRNWIKEHATATGYERHWQLDDNIRKMLRQYRGSRIYCPAGVALAVVEDFVDRYENVAVAGLNYDMFGVGNTKPFYLNARVYSCSLILNSLTHKWRGRYNEDADFCLQVLATGWCTILVNAFLVEKRATMKMRGGNTEILYQGDGRLKMARSLERRWPGVVTTKRRFGRPQHVVANSWRRFDTPLKLKPGVDLEGMQPDEYGLKLVQVREDVKSEDRKRLLDEAVGEAKGRRGQTGAQPVV